MASGLVITGDVLYLDGEAVARIMPTIRASLRGELEEAIDADIPRNDALSYMRDEIKKRLDEPTETGLFTADEVLQMFDEVAGE